MGLGEVVHALAEAEAEAAGLRSAWQHAHAREREHTTAARQVVVVALCREGVLKRDLAEAEVELAGAHAEARLARAALSSGASEAVRAHLASRMGEQATQRAQARAAHRAATTPASSRTTTPSASNAPTPPGQRQHPRAATPSEKLRRWRRDDDREDIR